MMKLKPFRQMMELKPFRQMMKLKPLHQAVLRQVVGAEAFTPDSTPSDDVSRRVLKPLTLARVPPAPFHQGIKPPLLCKREPSLAYKGSAVPAERETS
jgi:hypothetical protein